MYLAIRLLLQTVKIAVCKSHSATKFSSNCSERSYWCSYNLIKDYRGMFSSFHDLLLRHIFTCHSPSTMPDRPMHWFIDSESGLPIYWSIISPQDFRGGVLYVLKFFYLVTCWLVNRHHLIPPTSTLGEGQTDMPINHANQGEVLPSLPTRFGLSMTEEVLKSPVHHIAKWK